VIGVFGLGSWGEQLPILITGLHLVKQKRINGDYPSLKLIVSGRENEIAMRKDMMNSAAEMLESGGIKDIYTFNDEKAYPGLCIHEMGTPGWEKIPKHLY
jgi:hypothetical protein